jgi:hypothetical protein
MAAKQYKRIGWVVQDRETKKDRWSVCDWTFDIGKVGAKMAFEHSCKSGYCYIGEAMKGYACCVPVYVEVSDAD